MASTRLAVVVVVAIAATAASLGAASGPGRPKQPSKRFAALLEQYRHGDASTASDTFAKWKDKDVLAEVPLPLDTGDPWVRAAYAALHTEAALRNNTFGIGRGVGPFARENWGLMGEFETHSRDAALLIKDLTAFAKDHHDETLLTFCRDWYVMTISYLLRAGRYPARMGLWNIVDHDFSEDAQIHLLLGAVAEGASRPSKRFSCPPWNGPHGCFSPAQEAIWQYRHAIRADDSLIEAHLRLGRVWHLLGRDRDARPELERALRGAQAAGNSYLTYLAGLFLGEVDEETRYLDRKLDLAAEHYRIAVAAVPLAHTARVSLGQALVRAGHDDGWLVAREMFAGESAERPAVLDPWTYYRWAQLWQVDRYVADMRTVVHR